MSLSQRFRLNLIPNTVLPADDLAFAADREEAQETPRKGEDEEMEMKKAEKVAWEGSPWTVVKEGHENQHLHHSKNFWHLFLFGSQERVEAMMNEDVDVGEHQHGGPHVAPTGVSLADEEGPLGGRHHAIHLRRARR